MSGFTRISLKAALSQVQVTADDKGMVNIDYPQGTPVFGPMNIGQTNGKPYGGSEFFVAGTYGGRPPVKPSDPNEQIPTEWPGAPASVDEWYNLTPAEREARIKKQVDALAQWQFDHELFTDKILIDGAEPTGFQVNAGGTHTRRFTTSADGLVGKLGLEIGQPTTVAFDSGPAAPPVQLPNAEDEPRIVDMYMKWTPQQKAYYTYKDAAQRLRACDTLRLHLDVPADAPTGAISGRLSFSEFNAPPWARGLAVGVQGPDRSQLVYDHLEAGTVGPQLIFAVTPLGGHSPNADFIVAPGEKLTILCRSYGPADRWGDMVVDFVPPRN